VFIRENKTYSKKTGTTYVTHRLVESYRTEKGVRQRVILHLGTLTIPKSQWKNLAIVLESRLTGQDQMLETSPELFKIADEAILHNKLVQKRQNVESSNDNKEFLNIDINSIQTKEVRSLGPEIIANGIWNKLGFDEVLQECNFNAREIAISKAVILGRLISPSSDIDTWRWLNNRTSLIEILPSNVGKIGKNSVYEIVDLILANKEKIEYLLRKREDNIVSRVETIYLYDLTNTYFEGNCNTNDLAKRGKCKSKRTDCPLVTLALLVDSYGFPIFSEIYPGNQSEPATLKDILAQFEKNIPDDIRRLTIKS
jgi:hypothetical protein